uniref:Ionotropic receptor n=2 Tax=Ostrinia furnacalis TaxID=93504 RepID=A0A0F7QEG2_OSTFU|nr:ionotropic receptor [Ostrinia furnacalis]
MLQDTVLFFPVEILLTSIVNLYLNSSYCLTIVSEKSLDLSISNSFTSMVPEDGDLLVNQLLQVSEMGCSDYIVKMRDPARFMAAFERVNHLGNVRRSDRKVVFLPYEDNNITRTDLLQLLTLKETSFLANILLILPSLESGLCSIYDLATHKYTGPDDQVDQPYYMDRWNSCSLKFEKDANLFPHDMTNLHGKTVKVACFTYKPYALLDLDPLEEPLGRDGTEVRIVDEFCRWINCTIEVVRDDEHEWGELYDNQTGVGVLGNVVKDRADLGITALYSWYEEYLELDFSGSGIRTAITCVAPSPRLLASWEMPLLPFSWYMWMALGFTFVYASFALAIAKGCSTDKVFLATFGMMVTQSQADVGATWRVRSITGWMLLTGLVLDNAYGGGLASVFTVPKYEKSIDTVQDIVDRGMEWGATHDAWVFSLTLSPEPLVKQLVSLFRVSSAEDMKIKSMQRSMAFSVERLPAGYFAVGDYITKDAMLGLTLMQEDFYYEQCVVMMRKSSPYTQKVSKLIGRLHESGLMLAWETQVALKYLNYEVQLEVRLSRFHKDVDNVEPLKLRHVVGVFIIYIIGVIISTMLFILEIIHKHKKRVY